jgi:hypothetical protein
LPPIEIIIEESLKVKLNNERLDQLKQEYKRINAPQKQLKQRKVKKLSKVRRKAIENIEK